MRRESRSFIFHTLDYLVLWLIIMTGIIAFFRVSGQVYLQLLLAALIAISYFMWGVVHHMYCRDLNWKVVLEYFLLGLSGFVFLWMVLML